VPLDNTTYLTVRQVADRLSLRKADSVLALIHKGALPATDVSCPGGKRACWRIDPADLERFLLSRKTRRPEPDRPRRVRRKLGNVTNYF
jgi:excisionase family DNA binding protein